MSFSVLDGAHGFKERNGIMGVSPLWDPTSEILTFCMHV